MSNEDRFKLAADNIKNCVGLIITAGAGIGVDSGLPDFRGDKGFWNAYPMYERLGINFIDAANPGHFVRDPAFGWGFYGHRANLYRETVPHEGFNLLQKWIAFLGLEHFVVTSNVDGHFQKAGYHEDCTYEVHGSINFLQCTKPCVNTIWPNRETIQVDLDTMRAVNLPFCPNCGQVARPNVLMFGDFGWLSERSDLQRRRFYRFMEKNKNSRLVVIEIGAGTAVPTIRNLTERLGDSPNVKVVRVNPREPGIKPPHVSLNCGALEGLSGINGYLNS